MIEVLPILRKTLSNQKITINLSLFLLIHYNYLDNLTYNICKLVHLF